MKLPKFGVESADLPNGALLQSYNNAVGCYTDCYVAYVNSKVTLAEFVAAFYTTTLFKAERTILKFATSTPSTDEEARDVGMGQIDRFAAWRVERRSDHQLLMCDFSGRTRSWFMTDQIGQKTRLYFGSAVVPARNPTTGQHSMGLMFGALLGFHKLYSRALLSAAKSKLESNPDPGL